MKKGLANEIMLDRTRLIQIEFEKDAVACHVEGAHVVLIPRVVFFCEGVEGAHGRQHAGLRFEPEVDDAGRHHHLAAGQ